MSAVSAIINPLTKGKLKMKKIVLITYTVEADTDLAAIFALRKSLNNLSESELDKFDAFEVLDYEGELV
jgi:hypothetical protein